MSSLVILGLELMLSILLLILLHDADALGELICHLLLEVTTTKHYVGVENKLNGLQKHFSLWFFQFHNLVTQITGTNLTLQVQNKLILYFIIKHKRR